MKGDVVNRKSLAKNPDIVRQPSSFWKKSLWDSVGNINENLHVVMDYDLFVRFAKKVDFHFLNENLSFYRTYSDTKTLKLVKKQIFEIIKVVIKHYHYVHPKLMFKLFKRFFGII